MSYSLPIFGTTSPKRKGKKQKNKNLPLEFDTYHSLSNLKWDESCVIRVADLCIWDYIKVTMVVSWGISFSWQEKKRCPRIDRSHRAGSSLYLTATVKSMHSHCRLIVYCRTTTRPHCGAVAHAHCKMQPSSPRLGAYSPTVYQTGHICSWSVSLVPRLMQSCRRVWYSPG